LTGDHLAERLTVISYDNRRYLLPLIWQTSVNPARTSREALRTRVVLCAIAQPLSRPRRVLGSRYHASLHFQPKLRLETAWIGTCATS